METLLVEQTTRDERVGIKLTILGFVLIPARKMCHAL